LSATEGQASGAIRQFFYAGWGAAAPLCPVEYPNLPIDPPDPDPVTGASAWARLTINSYLTRQAGLNTDGDFTDGYVTLQVFVTGGTDEGPGLALTDAAVALFKKKTLAAVGVTFHVPTTTRVPYTKGDPWYQFNVRIPFWRH
jgi:hypothetical protein